MDPVLLSRFQFAAATIFHFFFVPLTIGLSLLMAIMETWYVKTGNEDYIKLVKFFSKIFLINFAVGIVTGITLEFQFGTNWSNYSKFVGDIFGSLLAIEATVAFFLESTFIAVWALGWKKLSPRAHASVMWLIAIGSNLSAYWIITANAWMQHPVGYVIRNGRAELVDFFAVITQKLAFEQFFHTVFACMLVGGFFVMGVSAYQLIKKKNERLFKKSFLLASVFTLIFSILQIITGHISGATVARIQPAKLAAMESHWETMKGAPLHMLLFPDPENEKNLIEAITIPKGMSAIVYHDPDAEVKGLKDFPVDERPPVIIPFLSFRLMVGMGFLMPLISILGLYFINRNLFIKYKYFGWIFVVFIPVPYLATQLGWVLTEVGRQPWVVYGIMRTSDAVSPVTNSQVGTSLIALILLYTFIGIVAFLLMLEHVRRGITGEDS